MSLTTRCQNVNILVDIGVDQILNDQRGHAICNHVIQFELMFDSTVVLLQDLESKRKEIRFLTGPIYSLSRKLDFQREEKIIPFYS